MRIVIRIYSWSIALFFLGRVRYAHSENIPERGKDASVALSSQLGNNFNYSHFSNASLARNAFVFEEYRQSLNKIKKTQTNRGVVEYTPYEEVGLEELFKLATVLSMRKSKCYDRILNRIFRALNDIVAEKKEHYYIILNKAIDKELNPKEKKKHIAKEKLFINDRYEGLFGLPYWSYNFIRVITREDVKIFTVDSAVKLLTIVLNKFEKYMFNTTEVAFEEYYIIIYELMKKLDVFLIGEEEQTDKFRNLKKFKPLLQIQETVERNKKTLKESCLSYKETICSRYGIIKTINETDVIAMNKYVRARYDSSSCNHRKILVENLRRSFISDLDSIKYNLKEYKKELDRLKNACKNASIEPVQEIQKCIRGVEYSRFKGLFKSVILLSMREDYYIRKDAKSDMKNILNQIKNISENERIIAEIEYEVQNRKSRIVDMSEIHELKNNAIINYVPTKVVLILYKNHHLHEERVKKLYMHRNSTDVTEAIADKITFVKENTRGLFWKKKEEDTLLLNRDTVMKDISRQYDITGILSMIEYFTEQIDRFIKNQDKFSLIARNLRGIKISLSNLAEIVQKVETSNKSHYNTLDRTVTILLPKYKKILVYLEDHNKYAGLIRLHLFYLSRLKTNSIEDLDSSIQYIEAHIYY